MKILINQLTKRRVLAFSLLGPLLNLFFRRKAIKLLTLRSALSLSDTEELAADIPIKYYYASTPEIEKFNGFYGISTVLKEYANLPDSHIIKAHIEHAISFSDSMFSGELNCSYPTIILCGYYREGVLKKADIDKKIYKVGPYISYSHSFLAHDKIMIEKKRLGRNILAFPQHSTPSIDVKYDVDEFCQKLREAEKNYKYQSTRICLYWKDIGLKQNYEQQGFEVVTAGHMFDPLFLPRLRSLIEISDLTISNSIGSHLGYSIALGRPHIFFRQTMKRTDHIGELHKGFYKKFDESTEELAKAFEQFSGKITEKQYKIANFYAGFDQIKTSEELKKILSV